jgi:hypothetical protein
VENYRADDGEIASNFVVRESQQAVSEPPRLGIANRVISGAMQRAVQLDDQPLFQTHEIDDVAADRNLALEFETTQLAVADLGPEEFSVLAGLWRISLARSRFSASASRFLSVNAPTTPSPRPHLPAGEREKIGYKRR